MKTLLKTNRLFFLTYGLVLLGTGTGLLLYTKEELMRWANGHHHPAADLFFRNVTHLGDGAFFVFIVVLLAFRSFRYAAMGLGSFLLSSGVSQGMKHYIFTDSLRPVAYFEHSTWQYRVIEGLDIHRYNSFPSGHATSAFAVFCLLALLDDRKGRGWFFAALASVTAYSRVYLFQHFVGDVFAGSIIGTLSSVAIVGLLSRHWTKYPKPWHDRRINGRKGLSAKT